MEGGEVKPVQMAGAYIATSAFLSAFVGGQGVHSSILPVASSLISTLTPVIVVCEVRVAM